MELLHNLKLFGLPGYYSLLLLWEWGLSSSHTNDCEGRDLSKSKQCLVGRSENLNKRYRISWEPIFVFGGGSSINRDSNLFVCDIILSEIVVESSYETIKTFTFNEYSKYYIVFKTFKLQFHVIHLEIICIRRLFWFGFRFLVTY